MPPDIRTAPYPPRVQALIDAAVGKIMKSVDKAIAAERARCAAIARSWADHIGSHAICIAEAIERGETDA